VQAFITAAHRKLGAEGDPPFNAVLFGEATAYPHGVPYPQTLKGGRHDPDRHRRAGRWLSLGHHPLIRFRRTDRPPARRLESGEGAQAAGFAAAKPGNRCEDIDIAARGVINGAGFGPAMRRPACRTAPATASASTCTNGPIS
jgi:Xaa-Pro dipeptidase